MNHTSYTPIVKNIKGNQSQVGEWASKWGSKSILNYYAFWMQVLIHVVGNGTRDFSNDEPTL